jgi:hypothetical protein
MCAEQLKKCGVVVVFNLYFVLSGINYKLKKQANQNTYSSHWLQLTFCFVSRATHGKSRSISRASLFVSAFR